MKIHVYDPSRNGEDAFPLAEKSPKLFNELFNNGFPNAKFCTLKYNKKLCTILFDIEKVAHISARQEFEKQISYQEYKVRNPEYVGDYQDYKTNIYRQFTHSGEDIEALSKAKAAGQVFKCPDDNVKIMFNSDTFRDYGLQDKPEDEKELIQLTAKIQKELQKVMARINRKI